MSDFDKEAEREKLREKYERDEADREATQRMSDLLLKGATMTNTHCGVCGDPLFRMNGTTFCPSCHGSPDAVAGPTPGDRPGGEQGAARSASTAGDPTDDGGESAGETGESPAPGGDSPRDPTDAGPSGSAETSASTSVDGSVSAEEGSDASRSTEAGSAASDRSDAPATAPESGPSGGPRPSDVGRSSSDEPDVEPSPGRSPEAVEGDLESARSNLARALERFSEEAAEADDPRYAAECLEAAREAAETLSVLRR